MFAHYLQLGLRSLRRNPVLTILMVIVMGFGVSASMASYAVFRAVSNDPIPDKSTQLYAVQIDSFGPKNNNGGEPSGELDYLDAMALQRDHKGLRQTPLYPVGLSLLPTEASQMPLRPKTYAVNAEAFPMFEIPFAFGGGWSKDDDRSSAYVAVIGRRLNDRLFRGANSIGKSINLSGHDYRIVGVMDDWDPKPLYMDVLSSNSFGTPIQVFIPLQRALDSHMQTVGSTGCVGSDEGAGWEAFTHSTCTWLLYWVELPTPAQAQAYGHYLYDYASLQQHAGRYPWAPNVRLHDVRQWLKYMHVVSPASEMSLYISCGVLLICLVNTSGLLLAKFMRRSAEIGVRRALGAPRRAIYAQFLMEGVTVGLAGGVLGLLLTVFNLHGIGSVVDKETAALLRLDASLVAWTFTVSVISTLLASFYPTWRAANVQPAWQLKTN
ncbi:ABC transporter permease [Dyella acidiphila]|uniref:ABC transporter permease n=1 Tax=Dyella acidiphila TaxID=2775866 RepID=A0ABR9GG66_9GAMM|nr:ABC transporter permease [Dyella acidiphila]MBE1163045.1 ABC transporter permease [Dyella acidiphila]